MSSLPKFVIKKSGNTVRFRREKLEASLRNTLRHAGRANEAEAKMLQDAVLRELAHLNRSTVRVEEIRSTVLSVLSRLHEEDVMNAYDLIFLHLKDLTLKKVVKRNGSFEDFDPMKIFKALRKSLGEARIPDARRAEELTREAVAKLEEQFRKTRDYPTTHTIKRAVETVLETHALHAVRDVYRLHRYR